jgi:small conductance mechanosensitive channel
MDFGWNDISALIKGWMDPQSPLGVFLSALLIFLGGWVLSWLLGRLMQRSKARVLRVFKGVDETVWRLFFRLKNVLVFLLALAVFASVVPGLKTLLGTLLAGAGVTAIIIGFAAKSTLSNLISGLTLAVYRPISIGDAVEIEGYYGRIEDITLRHTVLLTWEQKRIIIPNERLDNMTLVNYSATDRKMMLRLDMGVSYDTDLDLARRLILEEAAGCPHLTPVASASDPPSVYVAAHADFSITLRLFAWADNVSEYWSARYWMLERVKKRFDQEGVEIPFPYRTLVYKSDIPPARRPTEEQLAALSQDRPRDRPEESPRLEQGKAEEPDGSAPRRNFIRRLEKRVRRKKS